VTDPNRDLPPHRILIEFPNDHDIAGAKFDVTEITPEQIAVAIFHLNMIASALVARVAMNARQGGLVKASAGDLVSLGGNRNGGRD
jgi:hypothetical protein